MKRPNRLPAFGPILALLVSSLGTCVAVAQEEEPTVGTYSNVAFTVIIEDDEDHVVGALDILEVALGEPGNQTLVVRFKAVDFGDNLQDGDSIDFFYEAGGGEHRSGIMHDGSAKVNQNQDPGFDSCVIEGEFGYCIMPYEKIEVAVGDQITATVAISYSSVAQDYAPGGLWVPDGLIGGTGDDYTLVGSTAMGGNVTVELEAAATYATAAPGGGATYELNVTTESNTTTNITLEAEGLPDGFDTEFEPANATVSAGESVESNLTVVVPDNATEETINFTVVAESPDGVRLGELNLTLEVSEEAMPTPTHTGTTRPDATNRTRGAGTNGTGNRTNETGEAQGGEDEGFIPGFQAFGVALAAAAVVALRRRRSRRGPKG